MSAICLKVPRDPIAAIEYLNAVSDQIEEAYAEAYFSARFNQRLTEALEVARHSRKAVIAMTRSVNNRMGRPVRWSDAADPLTSTYRGDC